MKLGSSMRRRRGGGGGSSRKKSGSSRRPLGPGGRLLVFGLTAAVVGIGAGYLYATQVAFPAPATEVGEFRTVPNLRGMTADEARAALANVELEAGRVDSIRHPEIEEGTVMGQTPLAGQLAVLGGEVEITVSLGPERRPIPDVTRLLANRAVTVLETTGFRVEVDSVEADVAAGRVVETQPAAGEEVTLPGLIRVLVSLGPPLVEMPLLVGMQEEQARELLMSLGLEVGEVDTAFRFGFNQGQVLEQLPEAGEEIPRGSEVRLVVGRRGFFRDPPGTP
jgi:eukaryotic-like serine/threonine-protein kinase